MILFDRIFDFAFGDFAELKFRFDDLWQTSAPRRFFDDIINAKGSKIRII
jgi:hypothetical protein